jgi:hypothetical protein
MEQQAIDLGPDAEPHRERSQCKACKAPVFYAKTNRGGTGIYDWEPDPNGRTILSPAGIAIVFGGIAAPNQPRYTSHFSSCPFRDQYRS